jgi:hypothetical protein
MINAAISLILLSHAVFSVDLTTNAYLGVDSVRENSVTISALAPPVISNAKTAKKGDFIDVDICREFNETSASERKHGSRRNVANAPITSPYALRAGVHAFSLWAPQYKKRACQTHS